MMRFPTSAVRRASLLIAVPGGGGGEGGKEVAAGSCSCPLPQRGHRRYLNCAAAAGLGQKVSSGATLRFSWDRRAL